MLFTSFTGFVCHFSIICTNVSQHTVLDDIIRPKKTELENGVIKHFEILILLLPFNCSTQKTLEGRGGIRPSHSPIRVKL